MCRVTGIRQGFEEDTMLLIVSFTDGKVYPEDYFDKLEDFHRMYDGVGWYAFPNEAGWYDTPAVWVDSEDAFVSAAMEAESPHYTRLGSGPVPMDDDGEEWHHVEDWLSEAMDEFYESLKELDDY